MSETNEEIHARPGDTVIVKMPAEATREHAEQAAKHFREWGAETGVKYFVVSNNMDVSVMMASRYEEALRRLIESLDEDLFKVLENDEVSGKDHFPDLAKEFRLMVDGD